MDKTAQDILVRFEARIDAIADEIADATITEVAAFGPMTDERLRAEVRALARGQLDGFLAATRAGTRPGAAMLQAVRDRATTRARQLVPLAAMLHRATWPTWTGPAGYSSTSSSPTRPPLPPTCPAAPPAWACTPTTSMPSRWWPSP